MPTTLENLGTAFAGESQANRKYLAFAIKAEKEGFATIARLFRAAAEAETIHAHGHLAAMDGVGSTRQNLEAAVQGETYEFTRMYPPMLEQAVKEGHRARVMFGMALKAEEVHAQLYRAALDAIQSGADMAGAEIYLCPVCGNIEIGKPEGPCSICGAPADRFRLVA